MNGPAHRNRTGPIRHRAIDYRHNNALSCCYIYRYDVGYLSGWYHYRYAAVHRCPKSLRYNAIHRLHLPVFYPIWWRATTWIYIPPGYLKIPYADKLFVFNESAFLTVRYVNLSFCNLFNNNKIQQHTVYKRLYAIWYQNLSLTLLLQCAILIIARSSSASVECPVGVQHHFFQSDVSRAECPWGFFYLMLHPHFEMR